MDCQEDRRHIGNTAYLPIHLWSNGKDAMGYSITASVDSCGEQIMRV